jgi:hypothetical protein
VTRGIGRWELDDPLAAIDAQIDVMRAAQADARADQVQNEELAVRSDHVAEQALLCAVSARERAGRSRDAARDFAHELDDLYTEREEIVPGQRPPNPRS